VQTMSDSMLRQLEAKFGEELGMDLQRLKQELATKASAEGLELVASQLQAVGYNLSLKADRGSTDQLASEIQAVSNSLLSKADINEVGQMRQRLLSLMDGLAQKANLSDLEVVGTKVASLSHIAAAGHEIHQLSAAIQERADVARAGGVEPRSMYGIGRVGSPTFGAESAPSPGLSTLQSLRSQHRGGSVSRLPQWSPTLV